MSTLGFGEASERPNSREFISYESPHPACKSNAQSKKTGRISNNGSMYKRGTSLVVRW